MQNVPSCQQNVQSYLNIHCSVISKVVYLVPSVEFMIVNTSCSLFKEYHKFNMCLDVSVYLWKVFCTIFENPRKLLTLQFITVMCDSRLHIQLMNSPHCWGVCLSKSAHPLKSLPWPSAFLLYSVLGSRHPGLLTLH